MKKVLVSIKNELLSTAVIKTLKDCGEFLPCQVTPEVSTNTSDKSALSDVDILLMEISYLPGATMEGRLKEIKQLRKNEPECKIVAFCDDTAAPELAHKVTQLKKDRLIDGFLYTSVTASYLMSTLASL
ncbi:MAG: hypothetical protein IKJ24_06420 [Clostridia bacterium]|nr:hypothetical protein [Clostridia bacterium]